jgi:hypothetical protein
MTNGSDVMRQCVLALYHDYAVPIPPEQIQQAWAGIHALGDKLTDAGAFVFKSGLLQAELATAARLTKGQAS